jgi:glycosyltransferase involved in cell wall biosynthesis
VKSRLAIFFPSFAGGGVQKAMLNLTEGLLIKGVDVDLVLVNAKGPFSTQVPPGARVFDMRSKRALNSLPKLVKYFKLNNPDTLLSAQTHINVLALWGRFLAQSSTKIIVSEHSTLTHAMINPTNIRERFHPLVARIFYPMADSIVAVSHGVADDLASRTSIPIDTIRVIYNPVVSSDLSQKAKAPIDHPWFAHDEVPVLLSVGRLAPAKDFPLLLNAFSILLGSLNLRLIILGEGIELARLKILARSLELNQKVEFLGHVENPYKYMARAKVFVLSSAWEGFGNVLAEAMACGTPVVSTDCPSGPYEILEGGKYGKLVPVGNAEALAKAIAETLEFPLPGKVLQKRAHDFSVDKITCDYFKLLFNGDSLKQHENI